MQGDIRRVVVTGMGIVSPVGNSVPEFWDSLKQGKLGIESLDEFEGFEGKEMPVHVAGRVKNFDPKAFGLNAAEIRKQDMYSRYATAATIQAMAQSGLVSGSNIAPEKLGVYMGSGIGGMQTFYEQSKVLLEDGVQFISPLFAPKVISNIAGGNIAIRFNAQGPCLTHVSACATGTNAIGEAYLAIKYGRADAIIAGGAEACVHPLAIGGFANCKALTTEKDPSKACLPFDARRGGFVMADGAGVLVLEDYEHAISRGAEIFAEITGYGNTCDAYHYTAPRPDAVPASRAIRMALEESGYVPGESMYFNAHGTGTLLNDKSETLALKLALGEEEARKISISSTKSMTGHLFGAAGAVELIATVLAVRDSVIPPTIGLEEPDPECDLDYTPLTSRERKLDIALSNSLGFGGHNACIAVRPLE